MNALQRREGLCTWLVKEMLFGNLTPEQEQVAQRAYHDLQMKISFEEETLCKNLVMKQSSEPQQKLSA